MGWFTPEQAEALAGTTVRVASLFEFDFASGTKRMWNGFGTIVAGGETWEGLGGLASVEGLEETRGAVSQQATITLSGVDPSLLAVALAETSEVQGRLIVFYLQLFDGAWQPLFDPIPIWFGLMQPPRVSRTPANVGTGEGATQSITLPCENLFYGRSRPPAGRYTDRDLNARFPGDRFLERVAEMVAKSIIWPRY